VPVDAVTTGSITASDGSTTRSANLTVNPPALSSIGRSPASVVGGNPITGTATLSGPAGPSGAVVTLTTTNVGVVVPASVTVPAGATSLTFTIATVPVEHTSTGTVSGTYLGVTRTSASITVNEPTLSSLTLNPTTVKGGNPSTGTVTMTGVAAVNLTIAIASNNDPVATVPATVVVPAGSRTGTFTVTTFPRTTNSSPIISATYFGLIRTATLTVTP